MRLRDSSFHGRLHRSSDLSKNGSDSPTPGGAGGVAGDGLERNSLKTAKNHREDWFESGALVGMDVAQQLPKHLRVGDGRVVARPRSRQTTRSAVHEVLGRLERADIDCVLKDVLDGFTDTLRRFQVPALLDAMEATDELGRRNRGHRAAADPGKDVKFKMPNAARCGSFTIGARSMTLGRKSEGVTSSSPTWPACSWPVLAFRHHQVPPARPHTSARSGYAKAGH